MAASVKVPNGVSQQSNGSDSAMVELAQQLSKLRNDIVTDAHTSIKVPKSLITAPVLAQGEGSAATMPASSLTNGVNLQAVAHNALPIFPGPKASVLQHQSSSTPSSSGMNGGSSAKPRANVMAEIQQKRLQLERALAEQLKQRKIAARQRTCDQEIVADFDVTEVLRKAHELVRPLKSKAANRATPSSDSFDENTFYSSQMNESTTTEEAETSRHPRRPMRVCRFFRDGKPCPYGEKCTFSHDPAIVRRVEADEQQRAGASNNSRANEQTSRRTMASPQPLIRAPAAPANVQDGAAKDPQTVRIAELEEQLRRMKETQHGKSTVVPRAITREDRQRREESVYDPPEADEFGRDLNMRNADTRRPMILRQPSPSQVPDSAREYPARNENPVSPLQRNVRVVRNHITSPYAPQPARVSPLAVAKLPQVSQLQRSDTDNNSTSRGSNVEVVSVGHSPGVGLQPVSSRKRRRRPDPEEQARNVLPRRENAASPAVRIKEEPISPSPHGLSSVTAQPRRVPMQPRAPYVDTSASRPNERTVYRAQDAEGPTHAYEVPENRPMTPIARRIVSRNGQHYFAHEDTDLRRVVSARQMRAPPSPVQYETQYSDPQPRTLRAASQIQYLSPTRPPAAVQYRASVQPQTRERAKSPQLRQVPLTPMRRTSVAMPPPSRRIVVDEFGNRYMEAPVPIERASSMVAGRHQIELDPQYEGLSRLNAVARPSQPVMVDEEDDQYINQVETPTSPQYREYPTTAKRRRIVQLDQDPYGSNTHEVYEPRQVTRYQDVDNMGEGTVRMQSVRPTDYSYEMMPREQVPRGASVRPQQPRIVNLGEHREMTPRVIRQVSVRPDDGFARPMQRVQRMPEETMYQYTTQGDEGHFMEPGEGMYEPLGSGSRSIVQRM